MSKRHGGATTDSRDLVLAALADDRRRRILRRLRHGSAPVSERDLATTLAAAAADRPREAVADDERVAVRVALVHSHLPTLAEAGLVEWDRDAGTVATTDDRAVDDPDLARVLEADADDWDAVLECVANRRRRVVLSVLRERDGPLAPAALATAVHAHEREGSTDEQADSRGAVRRSLYHVHVPKLAAAGLVRESDAGLAYVRHAALEASWPAFDPRGRPRAVA